MYLWAIWGMMLTGFIAAFGFGWFAIWLIRMHDGLLKLQSVEADRNYWKDLAEMRAKELRAARDDLSTLRKLRHSVYRGVGARDAVTETTNEPLPREKLLIT